MYDDETAIVIFGRICRIEAYLGKYRANVGEPDCDEQLSFLFRKCG